MISLRYTQSGFAIIKPGDDCDSFIDRLVDCEYPQEFCITTSNDYFFISQLMASGFLVMSIELSFTDSKSYIILPKLHKKRSILFFENLHVSKSVQRKLARYELRVDSDFPIILQRCVTIHGTDWLTPTLQHIFIQLYETPLSPVHIRTFGIYREGKLVAGEFGISIGQVYTSYSGYYEESSAGSVQLVHTARYLQNTGYSFWDLGMPLPYKTNLGAKNLERAQFIQIFRNARQENPVPL
jgi:Leu/Phe-tRNA-protein transferase